jgi:hypothetical protein
MKALTICVIVLLAATVCYGQVSGTARRIRTGFSLPSTCSVTDGDIFFKTAATVGPYYCSATDTWTAMGAASSALTGSGSSGRLTFWNGSTSLSSASTLTWASPLLTAPTLTLSSLTANSFLYSGTAGAVSTTAAPTNGQLLIGSTGTAPQVATISAGSSKLSVTNGAGSIALDVVPANITITDLTGTLTAAKGGTGASTWTKGDILYSSATNTLSKLAVGSTGQFLTVTAGLPVWTSSTSSPHSLLSTNHPDATPATLVRGDIIIGSGSTPYWTRLAIGTTGQVLHAGTEPSWSLVNLAADVTGTLPAANGGTGNAYAAFTGPTAARTYTLPDSNATILTTSDLTVLSASATLDFGSTLTLSSTDLTIAVTGAAVGDTVALGLPVAPDANTCFTAWVSATNVVTVRFNNYSSGPVNPASGTYKVKVLK